MAKIPPGVGPRFPQVVVLFGATGDLARRKLLPGLYHLATAGFIPRCRVIGVSLDDIDLAAFRQIARAALDQFFARKITDAEQKSINSAGLKRDIADKKVDVHGAQQAESWLAKRLSDLHKPHLMAGMPVAAKRFAQAIVTLCHDRPLQERLRAMMDAHG